MSSIRMIKKFMNKVKLWILTQLIEQAQGNMIICQIKKIHKGATKI